MSVSCRIFTGLTLEFAKDIQYADFRKCDAFLEKHPELDEYTYDSDHREGKLLLISDGMNGDFIRLVQIDKLRDGASLGPFNDFVELPMTGVPINIKVVNKMTALYEEYTGEKFNPDKLTYAMWSQWY